MSWFGMLATFLFSLSLLACAPPQDPLPEIEQSKLNLAVKAKSEFAFKLYAQMKQGAQNVFLSPYSISTALTMAYAGANGETADEFKKVLGYNLDGAELHRANSWLAIDLNNRGRFGNIQLHTANRLWGQKGYPFEQAFLDIMETDYLAGMAQIDFKSAPEAARAKINKWVEEATKDRIKDLFPSGSITNITKMVLANAIYFKGNWATQFEKNLTQKAPFYTNAEANIQVDMMKGDDIEAGMIIGQNGKPDVLSLPYKGEELSMLIVMPQHGKMEETENSLSLAKVQSWVDLTENTSKFTVGLPKFKLTQSWALGDILKKMGLIQAFDMEKADFTNIAKRENTGENLFIQSVVHKAFVEVNEEGTEAAAATGISFGATSAAPNSFIVDRPFIFMIYDRKTNNILFMGRIQDPTKDK
tara:strand:+ start:17644 stop:18891 length:1248 start_codon:yes stop_codon:yes gene_type:complete